jgi:hypothetical protein
VKLQFGNDEPIDEAAVTGVDLVGPIMRLA